MCIGEVVCMCIGSSTQEMMAMLELTHPPSEVTTLVNSRARRQPASSKACIDSNSPTQCSRVLFAEDFAFSDHSVYQLRCILSFVGSQGCTEPGSDLGLVLHFVRKQEAQCQLLLQHGLQYITLSLVSLSGCSAANAKNNSHNLTNVNKSMSDANG